MPYVGPGGGFPHGRCVRLLTSLFSIGWRQLHAHTRSLRKRKQRTLPPSMAALPGPPLRRLLTRNRSSTSASPTRSSTPSRNSSSSNNNSTSTTTSPTSVAAAAVATTTATSAATARADVAGATVAVVVPVVVGAVVVATESGTSRAHEEDRKNPGRRANSRTGRHPTTTTYGNSHNCQPTRLAQVAVFCSPHTSYSKQRTANTTI